MRLTNVTIDLRPLRTSKDLRLLLASRAITLLGSQVTMVAALVQVAQLTGSALAVGLLGAAELLPVLALSIYGGALGDMVDRRVLAFSCELVLAAVAGLLLANAALHHPLVWPIFVCSAAIAGLTVLQRPALDAAVPRLVDHTQLAAAAVLLTISINAASIAGPAIGGVLVAGPGAVSAYALDAATFALSGLLLWRLSPLPVAGRREPKGVTSHIADGLRYAWRRDELRGSYLTDLAAMVFVYPYALLPFLAKELDARWAVGLLISAAAVGGLLASATSGWVTRVTRYGCAILCAAAAWGTAVGLLGVVSSLPLALLCLGLAGAADALSGVFRDTLWNTTIDDEHRARLAGVEVLSYATGPPIGQARGGIVASIVGVSGSFWSGGLLCLGSIAAIALTHRNLVSFDSRTDEHAAAVRAERRADANPA